MLPFLQPKKMASVIIAKYNKDGDTQTMGAQGEEIPGLVEAMQKYLKALEAKDAHKMAECFKAAFELCESYPNDEMGTEEPGE